MLSLNKKFITDYKNNYYENLASFKRTYNKDLVILLYHGVSNSNSKGIENISKKHIPEKDFLKQMRYLKKKFNILSMDEVIYYKVSRLKYPDNSVVITFDDGFENNYSVAAPILNDLNIPATFYISSGMIGTKKMFWVDILEDCINRTKKNNIEIMLHRSFSFRLDSIEKKIEALQLIKNYCKHVKQMEKNRVVKDLIDITNVIPDENQSPNYLKLNWKQVFEMDTNQLFLVGGHSTFHDILSKLPYKIMKEDIKKSLTILEDKLNHKVCHYSYPEGLKEHYNEKVKNELKVNGIKACPSAIGGLNTIEEDLFELKRIMVGFWSMPFPHFDSSFKNS